MERSWLNQCPSVVLVMLSMRRRHFLKVLFKSLSLVSVQLRKPSGKGRATHLLRGARATFIYGESLMREMTTLTAVISKEEDVYVATCPEVGTTSQGRTVEEALANLREATELYLEEFPKNSLS